MGSPTTENNVEDPQNIKIKLPYDPAIPFLGTYPKKTKTLNSKRYLHPYVHCNIFYNNQDMETT